MISKSSDFLWIGGHLCLDFLNTEIMREGHPADLLPDAAALTMWLREAGIATEHTVTEDQFAGAIQLRAALRALVDAGRHEEAAPLEALFGINSVLRERASYRQLIQEDGQFKEATVAAGGPLTVLAEASLDLLCHHERRHIRRCEGTACVLYFLDTTKNHTRRWCRMSACGNREKAAAHYRRRKTTSGL